MIAFHFLDNTLSKDPEELSPPDSIKKTQCPMCHRPRSPTEKDREPSGRIEIDSLFPLLENVEVTLNLRLLSIVP